jgi:hypothetical protein
MTKLCPTSSVHRRCPPTHTYGHLVCTAVGQSGTPVYCGSSSTRLRVSLSLRSQWRGNGSRWSISWPWVCHCYGLRFTAWSSLPRGHGQLLEINQCPASPLFYAVPAPYMVAPSINMLDKVEMAYRADGFATWGSGTAQCYKALLVTQSFFERLAPSVKGPACRSLCMPGAFQCRL